METPKLLWLKEHLPARWQRAARFLDLPDFLSYRATGVDVRSLCTTVCKWTYLGHERRRGWDDELLPRDRARRSRRRGLRAHRHARAADGRARRRAHATTAAEELGLAPGTPVGVSIIDAHAGGLGLLGAPLDGAAPDRGDARGARRAHRRHVDAATWRCRASRASSPAIWGPYYSAMVPGLWLTEGGQSATGALIDHVIDTHARGAELREPRPREGHDACTRSSTRASTRSRRGGRFPARAHARAPRPARSSRQPLAARRSDAARHGERPQADRHASTRSRSSTSRPSRRSRTARGTSSTR